MSQLLTLNNLVLILLLHFSNRLRPVGQLCSQSKSAFCVKWWAIKYSLKQRTGVLMWTVMGVFTLFRGHCSGTAHHRATSKTCHKHRWVWTNAGKFTVAIIHEALHMKEGSTDIENRLLFTLPYLLFILLQNFTQTIANLHTWVEHKGTTTKNKKYFSFKRHK